VYLTEVLLLFLAGAWVLWINHLVSWRWGDWQTCIWSLCNSSCM